MVGTEPTLNKLQAGAPGGKGTGVRGQVTAEDSADREMPSTWNLCHGVDITHIELGKSSLPDRVYTEKKRLRHYTLRLQLIAGALFFWR